MQGLGKLLMKILYVAQIRKGIKEIYVCKSEHWMQTEYDDKFLDYRKLSNGNYIVNIKKDD